MGAAPQITADSFIIETRQLTKEFSGFVAVSNVDLRVRRHGEDVSLEVLRTRGEIRVSIVLAH